MQELIKYEAGTELVKVSDLPEELQKQIRQYAVIDILKDEAKETIKANNVKIEAYLALWLEGKPEATVKAYTRAIGSLNQYNRTESKSQLSALKNTTPSFFSFLARSNINPVMAKAEHVDRFINELKNTQKNNSVRLIVSACSSFYSKLRRYGQISINPFQGAELPKKIYKKSIQPDREQEPVISLKEYKAIIAELKAQAGREGNRIATIRARESARRILPAVRVVAGYGLRAGAVKTITRHDEYFSYTTKGNKTFKKSINDFVKHENLKSIMPAGRKPFEHLENGTLKGAFKRMTYRMHRAGKLRRSYSIHDLRHLAGTALYEKTKDIVKVKNFLNHASINVTDIYLQSIGAEK